MKHTLFICLFLLFLGHCSAQEGTNFEELTLKEALAKAETTGKKVFIDCYTKTCGPCKYMVKFIFPLKECGEYFNSNYICIMKDMQEGEGIDIAKKYNVRIYPTYLILNPDGSVYCCMEGAAVSSPKEDFVQKVKDAIQLAEFNRQYQSGRRDKAFLEEYMNFLRLHSKKQLQFVMNETMTPLGVKKLCESHNWELIKTELNNIDLSLFRYLLKNRKKFSQQLGREEVEKKIISTYKNEFQMYKAMGIDLEKRMEDLKCLEKDGYQEALPLRCSMFFFQTISKKQKDQIDEILDILQNMAHELSNEEACMLVLRELPGFERIANQQQKEKAGIYLREIGKHLQVKHANYVQKIIRRITGQN